MEKSYARNTLYAIFVTFEQNVIAKKKTLSDNESP